MCKAAGLKRNGARIPAAASVPGEEAVGAVREPPAARAIKD